MGTWIVGIIIFAIIGLAGYYVLKKKDKCCGCEGCKGCDKKA